MKNEITTLEQAGKLLIEKGVVDYTNMTVEGKQLLDVCGYSYGKDSKKFIDRLIAKHGFSETADFNIDIDVDSKSRIKPKIYKFTMNAANHTLLAAMTDKGKAARQEAIDLKVATKEFTLTELESLINLAANKASKETANLLEHKFVEVIKAKDELIHKKSQPLSLTTYYGNNKVVQAANLYLEELGYQSVNIVNGVRKGWNLSDKGRKLGSQVGKGQIFWIPEIKDELPKTSELLSYAERLNLKDHRCC